MTAPGNFHPNVYQPSRQWSEDQTLHVAVAYSNPRRFRVRRELANNCIRHLRDSANVALHVGEIAYGDRPYDVTGTDPLDVQLRTSHELWHKENILNICVSRFPTDWKYGAYVDADFVMTRHDWALEAIHLLQHYDFVQLFSSYAFLSSQYRPHALLSSFAHDYMTWRTKTGLPNGVALAGESTKLFGRESEKKGGKIVRSQSCYGEQFGSTAGRLLGGPPGGAWAFRRSAFDAVGGLLDICIAGAADHYMALGLVGERALMRTMKDDWVPDKNPGYFRAVTAWQDRAAKLDFNIGCLNNHAIHHFHGPMKNRAYHHPVEDLDGTRL